MKPDIQNLINLFEETSNRVKVELQTKGFVLPTAHEGGIKFKHLYVRKYQGLYRITNLHNVKKVYYQGISNIRIAMTIAILEGCKKYVDKTTLLDMDRKYAHCTSNLMHFEYTLSNALARNDDVKADIVRSRMDYYQYQLEKLKNDISIVLSQAENNLFDNK